jgi:hypothetical protein
MQGDQADREAHERNEVGAVGHPEERVGHHREQVVRALEGQPGQIDECEPDPCGKRNLTGIARQR